MNIISSNSLRNYTYNFCFIFCLMGSALSDEYSGKLQITKNLENVSLSFTTDYVYNEGELDERYYDIGVAKALQNNWSASFNYRSVYTLSDNNWDLEKLPHAQLQKSFKNDLVKLTIRNRIEYRLADSTESFRNRTKIALQSRNEILRLKPFIANEFYYDFDEDKYNKNSTSTGFAFPRKSFGEVSIYYKYKMDLEDNGDWSSSYIVVAKLSYDF